MEPTEQRTVTCVIAPIDWFWTKTWLNLIAVIYSFVILPPLWSYEQCGFVFVLIICFTIRLMEALTMDCFRRDCEEEGVNE